MSPFSGGDGNSLRVDAKPSKKGRHRLSKRALLEWALEGVKNVIGTHPAPLEYPEDIEEYEKDLKEIERRIKLVDAQEAKKSNG